MLDRRKGATSGEHQAKRHGIDNIDWQQFEAWRVPGSAESLQVGEVLSCMELMPACQVQYRARRHGTAHFLVWCSKLVAGWRRPRPDPNDVAM